MGRSLRGGNLRAVYVFALGQRRWVRTYDICLPTSPKDAACVVQCRYVRECHHFHIASATKDSCGAGLHVGQTSFWYVLTPQHARIGFNIEVVCLPIDLSFHIRATTMFFLVSSTCEHGQSAIALHNVRTKQIKITIKTMRRQRPGQGRRPRAPSLRLEACATFSAAVHRSSDSKRHRVHLGR